MTRKRAHWWSLWLAAAVLFGIAIGATLFATNVAAPTSRDEVVALAEALRSSANEAIALAERIERGESRRSFDVAHVRQARESLARIPHELEEQEIDARRRGDTALVAAVQSLSRQAAPLVEAWPKLATADAASAAATRADLARQRVSLDLAIAALESR